MLFENSNKVRREFFTHITAIAHATQVEPLRLQKLSFLNPPPLKGQELLRIVFYPLKDGGE